MLQCLLEKGAECVDVHSFLSDLWVTRWVVDGYLDIRLSIQVFIITYIQLQNRSVQM